MRGIGEFRRLGHGGRLGLAQRLGLGLRQHFRQRRRLGLGLNEDLGRFRLQQSRLGRDRRRGSFDLWRRLRE
ncbi:MAG: hypothetical protein OXH50_13180, partial [Gemmatimonadetes bacterium]|nr:hypothetical protein [Gemmatimonadota bacterium]